MGFAKFGSGDFLSCRKQFHSWARHLLLHKPILEERACGFGSAISIFANKMVQQCFHSEFRVLAQL